MTSVCHPFILIGTILLPDDCSDVYHQLEYVLIYCISLSQLCTLIYTKNTKHTEYDTVKLFHDIK